MLNACTHEISELARKDTGLQDQCKAFDNNANKVLNTVESDIHNLSARVDHRRAEFNALDINLDVAWDRIVALECLTNAQDDTIKALTAHLNSMEDQLCHCSSKGKGREVDLESNPGVLGSPIDLARSSDGTMKNRLTPTPLLLLVILFHPLPLLLSTPTPIPPIKRNPELGTNVLFQYTFKNTYQDPQVIGS